MNSFLTGTTILHLIKQYKKARPSAILAVGFEPFLLFILVNIARLIYVFPMIATGSFSFAFAYLRYFAWGCSTILSCFFKTAVNLFCIFIHASDLMIFYFAYRASLACGSVVNHCFIFMPLWTFPMSDYASATIYSFIRGNSFFVIFFVIPL